MADQTVTVKFRVSDDGTLQVIDSAGKKIETLGTTASTAATKIARDLGVAIVGVGTAAALAARQLTQLVTSQAAQVEQLGRMSQQLGIGIREISSLGVAAQVSGASMESVVRGVAFLGRAIAANNPLLKEFGITSRDTNTALGQLADAYQRMEDGPRKLLLGQRLLGRGFLEMIPLLNQGSAGLREMQRWADRLGLTLSQDVADQFMLFDDTVDLVHASVQGLRLAIARELLPVAQQIAEAMLAWVEANRQLVATNVAEWATSAGNAILGIAGAIKSISDAWNAIPSDLRPILIGAAAGARYSTTGALIGAAAGGPGGAALGAAAPVVIGAGVGAFYGANREIQAETARVDAAAAVRRAFEAGGMSPMDWEGTTPVDWNAINAGRGGVPPQLGGGRKKGGGGGTSEAEDQAKRLLDLGKQNLDQLEALREAESLRATTAAQAAEFELQVAQQRGASYDELIAKAEALDAASNRAYQSEIENLQKQRAAMTGGGEIALIDAQIAAKEQERLQKIGAAVRQVTDEWRKQHEVIVNLGDTFESSFQRVIDGVLNSAGKFDLGEIARNTMRTMLSELTAGFVKAQLVKGEKFDIPMGENFTVQLPGMFKQGVDAIGSLWSQGMGALTSTTAQAAGNVQAQLAQLAASPYATGGGAVGAGTVLAPAPAFWEAGIEGAGTVLAPGGTAGGLTASAIMATVMPYLGAGLAIMSFAQSIKTKGPNQALKDWSPLEWMGVKWVDPTLSAFGVRPPTKSVGEKKGLDEILDEIGLPQQRTVRVGDRTGVRAMHFERPLYQEQADFLTRLGLPAGQIATQQKDFGPLDLERMGAGYAKGGARAAMAQTLGLGFALSPQDASMALTTFNSLTANMAAMGLTAKQANAYLLELAEGAGVTLVGALKTYRTQLMENDVTETQYKEQVKGIIELFSQDLPAGIDLTTIAMRNYEEVNEKQILNASAFEKDLARQVELWGNLWSTIESGISGALKQYAETVSSLPSIEQVLGGTGDITQLVQRTNAITALKEQMRASLRSAVIDAMTEGLMATIKESSLWKRMEAGIQLQITGQGSFNATQFVNLLLQKYGGAIDAIATAAVTMNAVSEQAAAKVAALDTTAQQEALRERATQVRFGMMRPRQQQAWLTGRIGSTEAELAGIRAGGVLDSELVAYQKKLGLQASNYEQMIALGSRLGGRRGRVLQEQGAAGLDALADAWERLPDINKEIHDEVVNIANSIPDIPEAISQGWKDFIEKVMGGDGTITDLVKEVRAQTKVTLYENYAAKGGGLENLDISKYTFLKANEAPINDILAYLRTGIMPGNYGAAWAATQGTVYRPRLGPPTGGLTPDTAGRAASGDRVQQIDIAVNVEGGASPAESANRIGDAIVFALRTNPVVRQEVQRIAVNG